MKIRTVSYVSLVLALVLASCTPAATPTPTTHPTEVEKKVVVVWHGDSEPVARITEELIETEFYELYPNIEVKYELAPEPFQEKLLVSIPAGTGPDLFEWNHDWLGTLVKADLLEPIGDLVTQDIQDQFVASAFRSGQFGGELYTLPISAEAGALAYNRALLGDRAIPTTTDELKAIMAEFKDQGIYGISYPFVPFLVSGFVHAYGGWFWDDDTQSLGVNRPETKQAMQWVVDTFKPYMSEDPSWDPQVVLFPESKAPFAINGPWMTGGWTDAGIDYGITPLPVISETGETPQPYVGVKSIYMTTNVSDKEAAFTFMVWATTSRERILERAMQLGYIPVLKEAMELPEIQGDPIISGFAEQVALGIPMSSSPEMVAVWGPFDEALRAMFTGVMTVDEALNDAHEAILEAIEEME
jgi:arabinogalactan oligomer/maltooligosaccharide transport system substrate-binding protein